MAGTEDQSGIVRFTAADEISRKINLFRDGQVICTSLRAHHLIKTPATFSCQFQDIRRDGRRARLDCEEGLVS